MEKIAYWRAEKYVDFAKYINVTKSRGLWHAWEEWDTLFLMRKVKETDRRKKLVLDI